MIAVVFMGSEKYPEVNSLDDYISKHGGETNAWTDNEKVSILTLLGPYAHFGDICRQCRHSSDCCRMRHLNRVCYRVL